MSTDLFYLCQRCLGAFDGHVAGIGDEGGNQYILTWHITTTIQNHTTLDLSAAHAGDHAQLVLHLASKGLLRKKELFNIAIYIYLSS